MVGRAEQDLHAEALMAPRLAGTMITRQLRDDRPGLSWCVAIGIMGCPKNFYHGATVDEALACAETDLLTPVVPTQEMCIWLAKDPKMVFYKGPGIPAKLNLDGIDLEAYKGRRRKSREICLLVESVAS